MNIKPKTRAKYAWFLSLTRDKEPRPLERIPLDELGGTAIEAFHLLESEGRRVATREPELLERYMTGKAWHGVTVATIAEDFVFSRTILSEEIKSTYPKWVAEEIFSQAKKTALQKLGFIPTFVTNSRDWSEITPKELSESINRWSAERRSA